MKAQVKRFSIIGLLVALFACVLLAFVPLTATTIADEPQTPVIEGTTGAGTAEDPMLVDEYLELVAAVNADVTNIKLTANLVVQIPHNELPSNYFLSFNGKTEYNLDLNGYKISITNLANRFLTGDFSVITVDENAVLNVKNGLIDFENGMLRADSVNANPFIYINRHGKLNSTNVKYINFHYGNTIGLSSRAEAVIKGGEVWAESGYAIHAVDGAKLTLDWNVKLSTRNEIGAYYAGSETGVGALFFSANSGELTVEAATFVGGVVGSRYGMSQRPQNAVCINGSSIFAYLHRQDKYITCEACVAFDAVIKSVLCDSGIC